MKLNIIRTILIILLLCTFYIIFGFSSQNSTQSAGISRKITNIITANVKSIQEKDDKTKEEILEAVDVVKKTKNAFRMASVNKELYSSQKTSQSKGNDMISSVFAQMVKN